MAEYSVLAVEENGTGVNTRRVGELDVLVIDVSKRWRRETNIKVERLGKLYYPAAQDYLLKNYASDTGMCEHQGTANLIHCLTTTPTMRNTNQMQCFSRLVDASVYTKLRNDQLSYDDCVYEVSIESQEEKIRIMTDVDTGYKLQCEFGHLRIPTRDVQTLFIHRVGVCRNGFYHSERILRMMMEQEMIGLISITIMDVHKEKEESKKFDLIEKHALNQVLTEVMIRKIISYTPELDQRSVNKFKIESSEQYMNEFFLGAESLLINDAIKSESATVEILKSEKYCKIRGEHDLIWEKVKVCMNAQRWERIKTKLEKFGTPSCTIGMFIIMNHYRTAEILLYYQARMCARQDQESFMKGKWTVRELTEETLPVGNRKDGLLWDGWDSFDFEDEVIEDLLQITDYAVLYIYVMHYAYRGRMPSTEVEKLRRDVRALRVGKHSMKSFLQRYFSMKWLKKGFELLIAEGGVENPLDIERAVHVYNSIRIFLCFMSGCHFTEVPLGEVDRVTIPIFSFQINNRYTQLVEIEKPLSFSSHTQTHPNALLKYIGRVAPDMSFCDCEDRFYNILDEVEYQDKWTKYRLKITREFEARAERYGDSYAAEKVKHELQQDEITEKAKLHRSRTKSLIAMRETVKVEFFRGYTQIPEKGELRGRIPVLASYLAYRCTGIYEVVTIARPIYSPRKGLVAVVLGSYDLTREVLERVLRERFPHMNGNLYSVIYCRVGYDENNAFQIQSWMLHNGHNKIRDFSFLDVRGKLISVRMPEAKFGTEFFYTKLSAV
ncbi:VP2 [Sathuvachari virus]|nr:VP2 [Sathuvachari virus]